MRLRHDQAVIANVGDSCAMLPDTRRQGHTTDPRTTTWVNEQRKLGLITAAEAEHSEKRHVLTRSSLARELFVTVDTATVSLKPGDVLVLCSDGLYGAMYPEDIVRFASQNKDAERIAQELVDYAVETDGSDNATAQVIQVRSTEAMGMYRGRLYPLPKM